MTSTKHDARRGARTLVLQGLYQRQLSHNADDAIRLQLLESDDFASADAEYLAELWRGTTGEYEALLGLIAPHSARADGISQPGTTTTGSSATTTRTPWRPWRRHTAGDCPGTRSTS